MKNSKVDRRFTVMCQPCESGKHPSCMNKEHCECGCRGGCGECGNCDEGILPCRAAKKPAKPKGDDNV